MQISRLLVGAVFILGCASGAMVRELVVPARAQGQSPVVHQYKVVDNRDVSLDNGAAFGAVLNQFGQAGWHLHSVVGSYLIFERALQFNPGSVPAAPGASAPPIPPLPAAVAKP